MATFEVDVGRPVEFVAAMLRHFGPDLHVALEGDLSTVAPFPAADETPLLRRNTTSPRGDFAIYALRHGEDVERFVRSVLPRVGLRHRVWHILVERGGRLVLTAVESFDRGCVHVECDERVLSGLRSAGVVRAYDPCPDEAANDRQ